MWITWGDESHQISLVATPLSVVWGGPPAGIPPYIGGILTFVGGGQCRNRNFSGKNREKWTLPLKVKKNFPEIFGKRRLISINKR